MHIGELAKATGCKVVTIRYYEKEGLLAYPERSEGNYRLYGRADLERLEFVMHCRKHGMSLGEIKELLAFRDRPHRDCTWVSTLLDTHIARVDARITSLEHLKTHLEQLRQRCAGGQDGDRCGIMRGLNDKQACCAGCANCESEPAEEEVRKIGQPSSKSGKRA